MLISDLQIVLPFLNLNRRMDAMLVSFVRFHCQNFISRSCITHLLIANNLATLCIPFDLRYNPQAVPQNSEIELSWLSPVGKQESEDYYPYLRLSPSSSFSKSPS